jgi:hypothetical protein
MGKGGYLGGSSIVRPQRPSDESDYDYQLRKKEPRTATVNQQRAKLISEQKREAVNRRKKDEAEAKKWIRKSNAKMKVRSATSMEAARAQRIEKRSANSDPDHLAEKAEIVARRLSRRVEGVMIARKKSKRQQGDHS